MLLVVEKACGIHLPKGECQEPDVQCVKGCPTQVGHLLEILCCCQSNNSVDFLQDHRRCPQTKAYGLQELSEMQRQPQDRPRGSAFAQTVVTWLFTVLEKKKLHRTTTKNHASIVFGSGVQSPRCTVSKNCVPDTSMKAVPVTQLSICFFRKLCVFLRIQQ